LDLTGRKAFRPVC